MIKNFYYIKTENLRHISAVVAQKLQIPSFCVKNLFNGIPKSRENTNLKTQTFNSENKNENLVKLKLGN